MRRRGLAAVANLEQREPALGCRNDVQHGGETVGHLGGKIGVGAQQGTRVVEPERQHTADRARGCRMQPEFEGRDDTEISAATAQCPEEIGVFRRAGRQPASRRGHDVGRQEVVAGETQAAGEPAEAAAQREAGDAGVRDRAGGGDEARAERGAVELAQQCARTDANRPGVAIQAHGAHRREVDHEAIVATRMTGETVAAGAHREWQRVGSREIDGARHVRRVGATGDQRGVAIESAVPQLAGGVVSGVIRQQQLAAKCGAQVRDVCGRKAGLGPGGRCAERAWKCRGADHAGRHLAEGSSFHDGLIVGRSGPRD